MNDHEKTIIKQGFMVRNIRLKKVLKEQQDIQTEKLKPVCLLHSVNGRMSNINGMFNRHLPVLNTTVPYMYTSTKHVDASSNKSLCQHHCMPTCNIVIACLLMHFMQKT